MILVRLPNENKGFTLIELIVTLTVAGILLTIAIPNFRNVIKNTQLTTDANELVTTLNTARSEAVKRAVPVAVCRSINSLSVDAPGTPVPSCTTSGTGWESGWIVFVDDGGGVAANANNGVRNANEVLLKIHETLDANITLRSGANVQNFLVYQANGTSRGNSGLTNDTFRLCDNRGTASAHAVVVNQTGRVRSDRLSATALTCP